MRVPDWKLKLSAELMAARKRAWKWGEHDCVTLGARCASAVTGEPLTERLTKFVYSDARGAAEIVKAGLRNLIINELGDTVSWWHCRHGDLVLCEHSYSEGFPEILTVHDGAQLLAPAKHGIIRVPFEFALCGWKL